MHPPNGVYSILPTLIGDDTIVPFPGATFYNVSDHRVRYPVRIAHKLARRRGRFWGLGGLAVPDDFAGLRRRRRVVAHRRLSSRPHPGAVGGQDRGKTG